MTAPLMVSAEVKIAMDHTRSPPRYACAIISRPAGIMLELEIRKLSREVNFNQQEQTQDKRLMGSLSSRMVAAYQKSQRG